MPSGPHLAALSSLSVHGMQDLWDSALTSEPFAEGLPVLKNLSAAGRSFPVESQPYGFQMPTFSSANKLLGLFVSFSLFIFIFFGLKVVGWYFPSLW